MNRLEAEKALYGEKEGSYLVRGNKGSYALSIKYVSNCMKTTRLHDYQLYIYTLT